MTRPRITRAEQETILRYDQAERVIHLWTAYAPDAARWRRLGYRVAADGHGWQARAPIGAIRLRKLGPDGAVIKRRRAVARPAA